MSWILGVIALAVYGFLEMFCGAIYWLEADDGREDDYGAGPN